MSNPYPHLTDEEVLDRFQAQVERDLETITDPNELAAMRDVLAWAYSEE